MILQALTRYYEDLLSRGEIAVPGWAPAKISLALYINENGELTQIVPTMVEGTKGKKTVMQPQLMVLPAAVKRTVSIASNFLWDNSAYLLGIDQKGKPERSRECFAAAAKLHHAVLDGIDSPNTAHKTNLVPLVLVGSDLPLRPHGRLSDIAPTMLELMHIEPKPAMTGESLIEKS